MEQYQTMEQIERKPVSTKLQLAALILGIIGLVSAIIHYCVSIYSSSLLFYDSMTDAITSEGQMFKIQVDPNGTAMLIFGVVVFLVCLIAAVLGIVGLVRSIRRPRTVKGIVFSAVGLSAGIGGLSLVAVGFFLKGFFATVSKFIPSPTF